MPTTSQRPLFFYLLFSILLFQCQQDKQEDRTKATPEVDAYTPLETYVHAEDPAFHYTVMHQSEADGYRYYVLKMVSQHWLTENEVDQPEWWHWVTLVVPDTIRSSTGLVWIGGGASDDDLPIDPSPVLTSAALATGTIALDIHNIPNQPLNFMADTVVDRYEDEIIAYGWRKFLEGGARDEDALWLARLPMTKAVTSAMNTASSFIRSEEGHEINQFVVSGASKRGWTTWTTAAVDERVVAIVPIVIDLLNVVPSFEHHWRNYGFWAPAVGNYVTEGIMDWMGSMEFNRLLEITEPYSYVERYDIPKLLINATGDQFFQPDSWQFYWDQLPGEKHIRYVPNTGHSLRDTDALESLVAFYASVVDNRSRPEYQWNIEGNDIHLTTDPDQPPEEIKLWYARNDSSRDFRIDVLGPAWKDSTLTISNEGKYVISMDPPDMGWKAYMVELTFPGEPALKFTTGVTVVPQAYPFGPFQSTAPKGTF